jgi:putative copper export protein
VVVFWIGLVLLDIFVSLAPGLQDGQRAQMIGWFRPAILVAILAIMATGIWQTMDNPFHPVRGYADLGELRTTTYGLSLFLKHIFVVATFGLTLLVHFVVAPRLARAHAAGAETGHLRQAVTWLSVLNGFACLATLLAATRMVWELH